MVLVTSANGRVGRLVIEELVKDGYDIRALDINPAAESLKELGVREVMIGDADDPKVVRSAMEGIDQVVYQPAMLSYSETEMINLATDTAIELGIEQYILLTVCHTNMSRLLQHEQKRKGEEHLLYEGLKHEFNFTILEPLHYTHNVIVPQMVKTGKFPNFKPLEKKLGYVDGVDVAAAVAKVLEEGEKHKYATYELCGNIHMSLLEIAELYKKLSGLPLETTYTERENLWRDFPNFVGSGSDSFSRAAVMAIRDTYNEYGFDANCNILEWLLGRPSHTMEDYLRRELKKAGVEPIA